MGDQFTRTMDLERGVIDLATGEFPAILATDGEASDGHILSIPGIQVPRKMPLLFGHASTSELPVLGSVFEHTKEDHKLRTRQRVNVSGEDVLSDVRRGIAQLIHDGDLGSMSIRWDGVKATPRRNLPSDHPAFWPDDKEGVGRWGLFFEKSRALEGSVVALGADPKALIGRAEAMTSETARVFFRALARSAEADADGMGEIAAAYAAAGESLQALRDLGCGDADLLNVATGAVELDPSADLVPYSYGDGHTLYLPRAAWESIRGESLAEYRAALAVLNSAPGHREPEAEHTREEVEDSGAPTDAERSVPVTTPDPVTEQGDRPVLPRRSVADMPATEFFEGMAQQFQKVSGDVVRSLTGRLKT